MKTITIYWITKDTGIIDRIRRRYNITTGMTVNGETNVTVSEKQHEELKKVEELGYIQLRYKNHEKESR
nr:MAG TPA: hypothetical protein [Caudoviricetes sp.]